MRPPILPSATFRAISGDIEYSSTVPASPTACITGMCENLASAHPIGMLRPYRSYYPALFSFIGLVLIFCHLRLITPPHYGPRPTYLFLPSDETTAKARNKYSKYSLGQELKNKYVVEVNIGFRETWDYDYRVLKIAFIRREIERLSFGHEYSTVLKIIFNDETTFGDFVGLINYLQFCGIKRYAFIDDCFYIFGNEPRYKGE